MVTVRAQAGIAAPPARVWSLLVDPSRFDRWVDRHLGFAGEVPAVCSPGTTFGQVFRLKGMPVEVDWTVRTLDGPRRAVFTGVAPMGVGLTATYLVTEVDGGCRVEAAFELTGAAVGAVAGLLDKEVGESLRISLTTLKALAESPS